MTETARALLHDRNTPADRIHREVFHADGFPAPVRSAGAGAAAPAAATATASLAGRALSFPVAAGQTVLDALLQVRPDAPYACKGGVCGTCRARLVDWNCIGPVPRGRHIDEHRGRFGVGRMCRTVSRVGVCLHRGGCGSRCAAPASPSRGARSSG